jgi:hypothetical protein
MRLVTVLALMAVVLVLFCSPAIPKEGKKDDHNLFQNAPKSPPRGNVTVIQGSKRFNGWATDNGRILIENPNGKIIMDGWMKRTGAVEIYSLTVDESYVGQVNPMGNGLLMSPKTGDTIRIEVER